MTLSMLDNREASFAKWRKQIEVKRPADRADSGAEKTIDFALTLLDTLSRRDFDSLEAISSPIVQARFWGGLIARKQVVQWDVDQLLAQFRRWCDADPAQLTFDFEMDRLFTHAGVLAADGFLLSTILGEHLPSYGLEAAEPGSTHEVRTRALFFIEMQNGLLTKLDGYLDVGSIRSDH